MDKRPFQRLLKYVYKEHYNNELRLGLNSLVANKDGSACVKVEGKLERESCHRNKTEVKIDHVSMVV